MTSLQCTTTPPSDRRDKHLRSYWVMKRNGLWWLVWALNMHTNDTWRVQVRQALTRYDCDMTLHVYKSAHSFWSLRRRSFSSGSWSFSFAHFSDIIGNKLKHDNRACHPGGHNCVYYPNALSLSLIWSLGTRRWNIRVFRFSVQISRSDLTMLTEMRGCRHSNPINDRQATCPTVKPLVKVASNPKT